MTSKKIRLLLFLADVTQADIARALHISPPVVTHVVSGDNATPYIRRAIAKAIHHTYLEVWGCEDPGVDRLPGGRPRKSERRVKGQHAKPCTGLPHYTQDPAPASECA